MNERITRGDIRWGMRAARKRYQRRQMELCRVQHLLDIEWKNMIGKRQRRKSIHTSE